MALPALRDSDLITFADLCRRLNIDVTALTASYTAGDATAVNTVNRLQDAIQATSDLIAAFCNRAFEHNAAATEYLAGPGQLELVVQRPPINGDPTTTISLYLDDTLINAVDFEVLGEDAAAGIIVVLGGVEWTAGLADGGIGQNRVVGHERRRYKVVYDGGYITPTQAGGANPNSAPTLPPVLKQAAIIGAVWFYLNDGTDPTLTSERLLSYGYTKNDTAIGDSGLPVRVENLTRGWKLLAMA